MITKVKGNILIEELREYLAGSNKGNPKHLTIYSEKHEGSIPIVLDVELPDRKATITESEFKQMFAEYEYEQQARRSSHHLAADVKLKWAKRLFKDWVI
jgi:hypothetical protein